MCLKINKEVFMNFVYSYLAGIFSALAMAFVLGQNPINDGLPFLIFFLIAFGVGLILVGFINFCINIKPKRRSRSKNGGFHTKND
jgi:hypothetical protein